MKTSQKGKPESMVIKLDISKAYDKIKWSYLERIMRKLGTLNFGYLKLCYVSLLFLFKCF